MKKLLKVLVLAIAVVLALSGCSRGTTYEEASNNKNFKIVTSFYPMYVFTLNIVKDIPGITVTNLTKPNTGCLHDYQLMPSDLKTLATADVFIVNGGGMETFLEKVSDQMPHLKIIQASNGIELIKDYDGDINPHAWLSVSNAEKQVENIAEGLKKHDQKDADKISNNAESYIEKLKSLREYIAGEISKLSKKQIVTFHDSFPYFAKEFGLNIAAVIEKEPDTEPSAGARADIIKTIKSNGIKAIFKEPQYKDNPAYAISNETGASVYSLDPITTGEYSLDAYEKIMKKNVQTLKEALK